MRKIIQLIPAQGKAGIVLIALCDDGTIWNTQPTGRWFPMDLSDLQGDPDVIRKQVAEAAMPGTSEAGKNDPGEIR